MIATATTAAPSSLTGTIALVRFALRRDRIRLAVWISVLTMLMVYAPNAIRLAYPDEAQRQETNAIAPQYSRAFCDI